MMGIPSGDPRRWYDFLRTQLLDRESREDFEFPAEYMFKNVPHFEEHWDDPVGYVLSEMDKHGIAKAMVGTSFKNDQARRRIIKDHPDRFFGSFEVDPNRGMEAVRELEAAVQELGVKAATAFPAGHDAAGADQRQEVLSRSTRSAWSSTSRSASAPACPGPRVPFECQNVAHIDEVCWFFPELKFVTRHGCEPWADLAVKLMLKWPNLYYSTRAFAPKYYPKDVVHFANTRGADKVMYAGLLPDGPHPRPHLRRDARRAVPRPRLAEVPPRERGSASSSSMLSRRVTRPCRCLAGCRSSTRFMGIPRRPSSAGGQELRRS